MAGIVSLEGKKKGQPKLPSVNLRNYLADGLNQQRGRRPFL